MPTKLAPGQTAPLFTLPDSIDHSTSLTDFKGKWVVLYFYPKDNTPGCTIEAIDFTRLKKDFAAADAIILGVSKDSCQSHAKFAEKQNLSILLLSDADTLVQQRYGVWRPKKFMGREFLGTVRSTFLINPDGKIAEIWDNVSAKGHAEDVLATLRKIQG